MKKSGKLLTLTKLGMGLVLILCVSLATFFMASCDLITVVVNGKFIDENGNLVITYSDEKEEVVGHVKGVRGLHGCDAPDGQGVVEVKTDDMDQLIVVYSDGVTDVTDEFGRVDESEDLPDSYADKVRIDSITRDGNKMTIHYLRGEKVEVDIDCDYKCRFKSEMSDIAADMIKDEVRSHKKDECGIYVLECPDVNDNINRSVFHGIYHRELVDYYEAEEGTTPCEAGGMLYKKCTVCGELVGEPEKVEPEGHKWGPWTVKTDPTYETEGELERCCKVCGKPDADIKKIPAINDGNYTCEVTKPKDGCTDATGEADYSYYLDGQKFTFHLVLPAFDHTIPEEYDDVIVEPGCEAPGKGHGLCPACGKDVEVLIPALGHDYVRQDYVVYDGDSKGHFVEICSRCGGSRNVDIVGGEWFWIGEITCGDDWKGGFEQYKYIADDGTEYMTEKLPLHEKPAHVIRDDQEVKIDIAEIAKLDKDNKVVTVEDAESGEKITVIDLGKALKRGIEVVEFADQKADCKDGSYGRGYIQCSECKGYLLFATYKNHPGIDDKDKKSDGWDVEAATCTKDGHEIFICPDCHQKLIDKVLKAPGHKPQYDELIKITNDDGTFTFTAKSHCSVCEEALPDKTNLKVAVGDIAVSSKVIKEPDCTNKGTLEVTYKYTDPVYPGASVTLTETEEIKPVSGAHLIKLTTGEKVHLKEVAVEFDKETGLYVLNIDDDRFEEGLLQEFADQKASCNEDGTHVYGRGYYICPECEEPVLILTYKDHS